MPKLFDSNDDTMITSQIPGTGYGFSAKRLGDLGASEYTLAGIATDVSGSVGAFRDQLEKAVKAIVASCKHSPRADNLMLRLTTFDSRLNEFHGFRPLSECDAAKYDGSITIGGTTALYDAAVNAICSVTQYGRDLAAQDYDANGIVIVVTDGCDNASKLTAAEVKAAKAEAVKSEALESIITILVGVNISDPNVAAELAKFAKDGNFDQYVEMDKADEKTMAKLAKFVSHSISSQSQALGTGGPSKVIDPNSLSI